MTRIILFSTFLLTSIHCLAAPVWKLPSGDSISITKEKRIFAPDSNLVKRLKSTNAISIVVWFRPENLEQEGPARILTLSKSSVERNFTVGQEGDRYEVRLRTTKTGNNGTPGLQTPKGTAKLRDTQLVYTWRKGGDGVVYLDGKQVAKRGVGGDIANWNEGFTFALGDELTGGRLWKGTVKSAEVYDHVLSPDEVDENFRRNGKAAHLKPKKTPEQSKKEKNIELFETKVTTILTQHCLECHDSVTEEGELDLSKRLPSHTEDGIFIAGNAADSLLWESIEFDDMPHNRDPLSTRKRRSCRSGSKAVQTGLSISSIRRSTRAQRRSLRPKRAGSRSMSTLPRFAIHLVSISKNLPGKPCRKIYVRMGSAIPPTISRSISGTSGPMPSSPGKSSTR